MGYYVRVNQSSYKSWTFAGTDIPVAFHYRLHVNMADMPYAPLRKEHSRRTDIPGIGHHRRFIVLPYGKRSPQKLYSHQRISYSMHNAADNDAVAQLLL